MAQITVNGNNQEVTLPLTLDQLITLNQVANPEMVSVQINDNFIEREKFGSTQIYDGDIIDFLYFMGGGR
ncbi:MAG: sulfur carrier protein ThiS [Bacteroidales bacterium]|jgi:sulfur carrier protein|nr:sulfur carrier protein ThiS [Bacteroidales bacterium]MBQ1884111.1 sulfur carrier protein ThiS [Bacteroidales bacterium]MBQ3617391.1 sulfur carrier protein ThiS [Bacteroidales bacterium]MBR2887348.1 sulfur carrier protein ThiS [Bacteroidales bacterium]MBR6177564.1 sulfur carrier protein ThiS [Bacteroidales bacterium]